MKHLLAISLTVAVALTVAALIALDWHFSAPRTQDPPTLPPPRPARLSSAEGVTLIIYHAATDIADSRR